MAKEEVSQNRSVYSSFGHDQNGNGGVGAIFVNYRQLQNSSVSLADMLNKQHAAILKNMGNNSVKAALLQRYLNELFGYGPFDNPKNDLGSQIGAQVLQDLMQDPTSFLYGTGYNNLVTARSGDSRSINFSQNQYSKDIYAVKNILGTYINKNTSIPWQTLMNDPRLQKQGNVTGILGQVQSGAMTYQQILAQANDTVGKLSNLNGVATERAVQLVMQQYLSHANSTIEEISEDILASLSSGVPLSAGSKNKEFRVEISNPASGKGVHLSTIVSQQKSDVEINMNGAEESLITTGFSIKSMSELRDTHLASSANVLGLLASAGGADLRYIYSALTVYSKDSKFYMGNEANFAALKKMILLKAMTGTGTTGIFNGQAFNDAADYMIFYQGGADAGKGKNSNNMGFRVISISGYISDIEQSNIDSVASFTWQPPPPYISPRIQSELAKGKNPPRTAADLEVAASATVSVQIKLSALQNLFFN